MPSCLFFAVPQSDRRPAGDFSDEVPDQFNLLPAVSAGLIRRMDDNLLYKLINDGVSGVTFDRPAGRSEP